MITKLFPLLALCVLSLSVLGQRDVEAILSTPRNLSRSGNFAGAAAEMNKALEIEPNNTRYLFEQAQYYTLAKNETAALNNVERALKLEPDNEATVVEAIRRLYKGGVPARCQRALDVANAFVADHPRSDKAYHWIYFAKQCLEDDTGALAAINKAVELNPTYPLYHSNRANLVSRMGDTKQAVSLLKQLIEILEAHLAKTNDRNAQAEVKRELGTGMYQLSVVYERNGDKALAIEILTSAIPLDPLLYQQKRAMAYSRFGMYKEALADIDRVIAGEEERVASLKKVLPDTRTNMSYYRDRAEIHFNAGEYQKALAEYQECLRRDPINKASYQRMIDQVMQKIEGKN